MRKLYTQGLALFLFLFSASRSNAQWVSIPDTNFGTWLNTTYTACMSGNNQVGWQMDTTCAAVVNATVVNCSNKSISNLTGIQYFDNLLSLTCSRNLLSSLPPLRPGLIDLTISYNQFSTLPALPNSLRSLSITNNFFTVVTALPGGLTSFYCYANQLASLPALPATLRSLYCYENQLNSLPALPNSLTTLWCQNNQLTSLPTLPNSLTDLWCGSNQLTGLPSLPNSLTTLVCSGNNLGSLPTLPNGLTKLWCGVDNLTSLPALPDSLINLSCINNQITVLPPLPNNLTNLDCNENLLSSLPALPSGLRDLTCYDNLLSSLPLLPNNLNRLFAYNNQLVSLPELPDSMSYCWIYNNPITCLPKLKRIVNFDFSNTSVTCLPNYGNITNSIPSLDSMSLCSANNLSGCDVFWNISGRTYFDGNNNCVQDAADTALSNVKVNLRSGGSVVEQTFSGNQGYYSFDNDSFGIYEVSIDSSNIPFYVICPLNNLFIDSITTIDSFAYSNDFALACKPGFDLTAWSVQGLRFRPTNFTTVDIHAGDITNFYGVHCASGLSGQVTTTISGPASFVSPASGALSPTVNGNTLTYNIADFGGVNFFSDFNIIVQTDTTAPLGSQVCFTVSVTPTAGDNNPSNNTLTHCFTVVGSFDPNDKQVYPAGDIDTAQRWLTYTVRFQNTGTAEAQHIYITDTLDSDLDVASFQLLAYSHQPMVQIKENSVRFNFPNINLPDSNTNEPASHGYVQYKIKIKDNKPIGTVINNTAFIYFDFNAPVVTNTTNNTISTTTGIRDTGHKTQDMSVYPNPASGELNIYLDGNQIELLRLFSADGKLLSETVPLNNRVDVSTLNPGIYLAEVTALGQRHMVRWCKVN